MSFGASRWRRSTAASQRPSRIANATARLAGHPVASAARPSGLRRTQLVTQEGDGLVQIWDAYAAAWRCPWRSTSCSRIPAACKAAAMRWAWSRATSSTSEFASSIRASVASIWVMGAAALAVAVHAVGRQPGKGPIAFCTAACCWEVSAAAGESTKSIGPDQLTVARMRAPRSSGP